MWDLPRPGLEPVSPALAGGFLTTAPPGKPFLRLFDTPFLVFECLLSGFFAELHVRKHTMSDCLVIGSTSPVYETFLPKNET